MQTVLHIALGNAVVAGAMALLLLPAGRWLGRPALTHALSLLILVKLVTPPLVDVPLMWPASEAAGPPPQAIRPMPARQADQIMDPSQTLEILVPSAAEAAAPQSPPVSRPWASLWGNAMRVVTSPWTAAAWAGSSALCATVVLLRIARLRRFVCEATVPGEDLSQEVGRLARQMGLAVAPEVRFIGGIAPPMLLAFVKARVLIPADLWSRLDDSKRQTLLLHELAHLRRRDHWVRYLELGATCLYWWHPAVWWARAALREAEEQCCDAWVIWAMPAARRAYMTTLLDAVDFISEAVRPNSLAAPVLASGMGQFRHLQRRLTMVRERSVQRRLTGGGLVAVVLSAIALPLGPRLVRADDAPPASDRPTPALEEKPTAPSGSDRRTPPLEEKPVADPASADPRAIAPEPTPADPYAKSGMSRTESLDAQLKAARQQIEDLQRQLAASNAQGHEVAIRRDGTLVQLDPPRTIVVDPVAPVPVPPTPAPRVAIRYSKGKLEAVTIPDERRMWITDIGPLEKIDSVDARRIIVHGAHDRVYVVAVKDGAILEEKPIVVIPEGTIGLTPANSSAKPESGRPEQTENRLDTMEKQLNRLSAAVERLTSLEAARAGQADPARDTERLRALEAEQAAVEAETAARLRAADRKLQDDRSAKQKDTDKPVPAERGR